MSLVIRSPVVRIGLIAGRLAVVAAAAMTSRSILLVVALLLLLAVATSLSQAGRLAVSLQGLKGQAINAVVWGTPIRGAEAAGLHVESVGAVGAGLLITLMDAGQVKTRLKVAQPRSWLVEDGRVVIADAAYVQWAGKRLARADGFPAIAIESVRL
jgi:hypothetical protein